MCGRRTRVCVCVCEGQPAASFPGHCLLPPPPHPTAPALRLRRDSLAILETRTLSGRTGKLDAIVRRTMEGNESEAKMSVHITADAVPSLR